MCAHMSFQGNATIEKIDASKALVSNYYAIDHNKFNVS